MYFPVIGLDINPLYPVSVAFTVSLFCSVGGISGAFLLLPWQISCLGYTAPGVSATNQIFNVIGCPGGIWNFAKNGRLLPQLSFIISLGTLPGVFAGSWIRINILNQLRFFQPFAALVLFYLGWKLWRAKTEKKIPQGKISEISFSLKKFSFKFENKIYAVYTRSICILTFFVGIMGGIYGVGGGALLTPFLVSVFRLPVHAIAGACLLATFITSFAGILFFSLLAWLQGNSDAAPDWLLGLILGIGGLFGMYFGAWLQKYTSPTAIRVFLTIITLSIGAAYLWQSL